MCNEYKSLLQIMKDFNWRDELADRHIAIREDEDYVLLKYNQIASDFNDPIVRACRGVILKCIDNEWKIVCAPFTKFSYGEEPWEQPINWNSAYVREKMDGSLMKAWMDNETRIWHLSTNGTIDAFQAEVGDDGLTFGDLFEQAIEMKFEAWATMRLNPLYTYMFELTSPFNKVVINYTETRIWLLVARNMNTLEEEEVEIQGVARPPLYKFDSLDEAIDAVTALKDKEGVVVCDSNYNRQKIKSAGYLIAHRLANNGTITTRRIIQMMKDLVIDDYLAYCGDPTGQIWKIQKAVLHLIDDAQAKWMNMVFTGTDLLSRKEFAIRANRYWCASFLFKRYSGDDIMAATYVMGLTTNRLQNLIERVLNNDL